MYDRVNCRGQTGGAIIAAASGGAPQEVRRTITVPAKPRKPNRRDPEKRRQQNRAAQKVYREKQKQKVRDLELQLLQVQTQQADEPVVLQPETSVQVQIVSPPDLTASHLSQQSRSTDGSGLTDCSGLDIPIIPDLVPLETPNFSHDMSSNIGYSFIQGMGSSPPMYQTTPLWRTLSANQDLFNLIHINDNSTSTLLSPVVMPRRQSSVPLGMKTRPTEAGDGDEVLDVEREYAIGSKWPAILHCSCTEYHEPTGQWRGKVQVFPDPVRVRWREETPGSRSPDVYRNFIRHYQECVIEAFRTNCLVVGITESMFCGDESESPFYRPNVEGASNPDGVVAFVQSSFMSLKYDLRPSCNQIATSHHPYIDIIPIPSVRKRLIELQNEIDEDAFFMDALEGFRCWGNRRESRHQGCGSGTSWDMRSWEATPTFLKKWACILGDEESEIARQSRWWRIVRGEEDDI
ncbi:hypothetical protein S40288_06706 [Stachybotrys chartarum IBT 40288]|nr:hypothetical protein S40288_06706 [Stachybotrys chartarum IBT 40288]